jgi:TolA-binding protein
LTQSKPKSGEVDSTKPVELDEINLEDTKSSSMRELTDL